MYCLDLSPICMASIATDSTSQSTAYIPGAVAANTLDLADTFSNILSKPEQEQQQVELVEQSDIRLMLFPSQIHKITSLILLLSYYRDVLSRLVLALSQSACCLPAICYSLH